MAVISRSWLYVALASLCVAALCLDSVEAGRRNKSRDKPCKYRNRGEKSRECDPVTNTRNMTLTRKKGNPDKCPETLVLTMSCRKLEGCAYDGKLAQWTECDPMTQRRTLVKTLAEGSPDHCPETHIKMRRCKKGRRGGRADRRKKGRKMKKKNKSRKNKRDRKNKLRKKNRRAKKSKVSVSSE